METGTEWCSPALRRGGDREPSWMRSQFQLGDDENVLQVNGGDSCTTMHVPLNGSLSQNDRCYVIYIIYVLYIYIMLCITTNIYIFSYTYI